MTATAPITLEERIRFQAEHCGICEAPDDREIYPSFDPGDLDSGVFKACTECMDECGLEKL